MFYVEDDSFAIIDWDLFICSFGFDFGSLEKHGLCTQPSRMIRF